MGIERKLSLWSSSFCHQTGDALAEAISSDDGMDLDKLCY